MDTNEAAEAAANAENAEHKEQNAEHAANPEAEARARRMGWRPESEFDDSMAGKPRKFLSAEEYLEKVESDLPILRERNRFLDQTVGSLQKKVDEFGNEIKTLLDRDKEQGALIEDLHRQSVDAAKRAYEQGRRELQAQIDEAVKDGNPEAVRQLTSEMVDLERQKPAEPVRREKKKDEPAPAAPKISDTAKAWIEANPKIMTDRRLNPVAVSIHAENLESGLTEEQSFAKLADQVREEMPHRFENPKRKEAAAVASASAQNGSGQRKKGFDQLPKEAQQTYERLASHFKAKGKEYTKEQYAKNYFLENAQ